jgi:hypothetical protein
MAKQKSASPSPFTSGSGEKPVGRMVNCRGRFAIERIASRINRSEGV